MAREHREVILSARIEYNYNLRNQGLRIGRDSIDSNIKVERLEQDVKDIIVEKLPHEMKSIFGIEVKTRIIATRYGSLTVFFGAIATGIGIIAGYKDFYDSIHLMKDQCKSLIEAVVRNRFSDEMEVELSIEHPRLPEPGRLFRRFRKSLDFMPEDFEELINYGVAQNANRQRRDGFFWYLLLMNIALLGVVAVLIGRAVLKVYFC